MIYFASDFHLGMPEGEKSFQRELKIVRWLEIISKDATEIYLLGDLFDFWFEYKKVVPRGFVRFLGKLAELTDKGIKIHICVGNHDLWIRDYLTEQCGARIFTEPEVKNIGNHQFYLHHGDGLGPGDRSYKLLKKFFLSGFNQFIFKWLHPNIGFGLASNWSQKSRKNQPEWEHTYQGDEKEYLFQHCKEVLKTEKVDFFIFGHRHLVIDKIVQSNKFSGRYINLGEWFSQCHYAQYDGHELKLLPFEPAQ